MEATSAPHPHTVVLSDEVVLAYVLDHSGCVGHLTAGRVERVGPSQLKVFDKYGAVFDYLSEDNLRSWCVFGPKGTPIEGWSEIQLKDLPKIGSLDRPDSKT